MYVTHHTIVTQFLPIVVQMCKRCIKNSLDESLVRGKIVLCNIINNGSGVLSAGAVGMEMQDGG